MRTAYFERIRLSRRCRWSQFDELFDVAIILL